MGLFSWFVFGWSKNESLNIRKSNKTPNGPTKHAFEHLRTLKKWAPGPIFGVRESDQGLLGTFEDAGGAFRRAGVLPVSVVLSVSERLGDLLDALALGCHLLDDELFLCGSRCENTCKHLGFEDDAVVHGFGVSDVCRCPMWKNLILCHKCYGGQGGGRRGHFSSQNPELKILMTVWDHLLHCDDS